MYRLRVDTNSHTTLHGLPGRASAYTPDERRAWWAHLLRHLLGPDDGTPYQPWTARPMGADTLWDEGDSVTPLLFPQRRTGANLDGARPNPPHGPLRLVPKELPRDQLRKRYVNVRFTDSELDRLDAQIGLLNSQRAGDGRDVTRASWVRSLVLKAVRRREERGAEPSEDPGPG